MTRGLILSQHSSRQHCLHSRTWRQESIRRTLSELPSVSVCMTKILKGRPRTLQNGVSCRFQRHNVVVDCLSQFDKKRKSIARALVVFFLDKASWLSLLFGHLRIPVLLLEHSLRRHVEWFGKVSSSSIDSILVLRYGREPEQSRMEASWPALRPSPLEKHDSRQTHTGANIPGNHSPGLLRVSSSADTIPGDIEECWRRHLSSVFHQRITGLLFRSDFLHWLRT